jgi:hypothetical protein
VFQAGGEARTGHRHVGVTGQVDGQVPRPPIGAASIIVEASVPGEGSRRPDRCGVQAAAEMQGPGGGQREVARWISIFPRCSSTSTLISKGRAAKKKKGKALTQSAKASKVLAPGTKVNITIGKL